MVSAASVLVVVLTALQGAAQRAGQRAPAPTYPWTIVPEDAIHGHLSEGEFREPIGVFFDPEASELYVADSKNARIGVFDAECTPVFSFGGAAVMLEPRTVVVDPDGTIFVLDAVRTELRRFNYRGEGLEPLRFTRAGEDGLPRPVAIAALARRPEGGWVVAERDVNRAWLCDERGEAATELPRPLATGEFGSISDVAVSADGLVVVADQRGTPAIHVYSAEGKLLAAFGSRDIGVDGFTAPIAVAFDESGFLYAVDLLRHDVKVFTPAGQFVARFGGWFSPETRGRAPGELLYPADVAIAPGGRIFVAERFGQRVQVFARRPLPERNAAAREENP